MNSAVRSRRYYHRVRRARRAAFTLVEALVGISMMSIAGTALLLGVSSTMDVTQDVLDRTIAQGMAEQLMEEVLGKRYMSADVGPQQYPLGPNAYELAGTGRARFDDIDDYHGYRSQPPTDRWNVPLGRGDGAGSQRHANFRVPTTRLANWRQEIDVRYVSESNLSTRLSGSQTSNYRVVQVRIVAVQPGGGVIELANLKRVVAYVP